jgi:glycosyltransferase involved in cell wall biosynthesis
MAYGVPVVARRTFGTECVLAGGGGQLIEPGPGEAQRFWAAIRDLLNDEETRGRLAAEARANAKDHPFSAAAERLLGVLRQVANEGTAKDLPLEGTANPSA